MGGIELVASGKRDDDFAKKMLEHLLKEFEPILKTLDELQSRGMKGQFQIDTDSFGRNVVKSAAIIKVIA